MSDLSVITYKMIVDLLGEHQIYGDTKIIKFNNIRPVDKANSKSIVFISNETNNKKELIISTNSKIIIIDSVVDFDKDLFSNKIFIVVKNPKIVFSKIGNKYFTEKINYTIHSSAIIHDEAEISENVFIGPNCVIGKGIIGEGTIIFGNVFIYNNFHIGRNVKINAGTVIGSDGFGYNKDENNEIVQFPHSGGVIIEDNVEIGSNTSIDRGSLSNTVIKNHAKIDNLVHIAHNCIIGERSYIIANTMIGGSSVIGNDTYVAPSASIRDHLNIGNNCFIGLASSVLKSIPENETWAGSPAQPLDKIKKLNEKLKKL